MPSGNHGKGIATHSSVCPPGYERNVGSGEKGHKAEGAEPHTLPFASFGSPQPGKAKVGRNMQRVTAIRWGRWRPIWARNGEWRGRGRGRGREGEGEGEGEGELEGEEEGEEEGEREGEREREREGEREGEGEGEREREGEREGTCVELLGMDKTKRWAAGKLYDFASM